MKIYFIRAIHKGRPLEGESCESATKTDRVGKELSFCDVDFLQTSFKGDECDKIVQRGGSQNAKKDDDLFERLLISQMYLLRFLSNPWENTNE